MPRTARTLESLNHPEISSAVDEREERQRAARRAAADELFARCAPHELVANEHATSTPATPSLGPLPLAPRAYAILGLVESYVRRGYAGVELGAVDIVRLFRRDQRDGWSTRNVWLALASLRRSGYLQRVTRTVPVEQTKLAKPYVSMTIAGRRELARRQGRRGKKLPPRCLHTDAPDAYARSQVRNLWVLGTNARAAKLGRRCGQLREQLALTANCTATVLPLSSEVSGSGESRALSVVAPVGLWTTRDGSRPVGSLRSRDESLRDAELSAPPPASLTSAAPPVADELGDQVNDAGGDAGSCEGSEHAAPPNPLRAWIGSLWRRFRGGDR